MGAGEAIGTAVIRSLRKFAEITQQTESSAAISAAAILDEHLRRAILTKMIPLSQTKTNNLFEGHGPLATFESRVEISFALGIIDQDLATDLKRIGTIRNKFAHAPDTLTFAAPKVVQLLKEIPSCEDEAIDDAANRALLCEALSGLIR